MNKTQASPFRGSQAGREGPSALKKYSLSTDYVPGTVFAQLFSWAIIASLLS